MKPASRQPVSSTRSLVIAPTWVGDTVLCLPVLDALAASGRDLTVLALPHLHPLLRLSPAVSALVVKSVSRSETISRMREVGADEAIILPNSFSAAWLARRAAIPSRIGYRGDARSPLLTKAVRRALETAHQLRDYDRLLGVLGVAPSGLAPRLSIPAAAADAARSTLERAGARPSEQSSPTVGFFAAAEFGASKRWPLARFAEGARRLSEIGARPVLVAGPKEKELLEELSRKAGDFPALGPELDLSELAAVLSRLDLLITNDSGPMHLAAAVGTPCVALFGPTDPTRTSPCGPGHRVLSMSRWCSPCFRRRCPLLHQRCMRDITVDRVVLAASEALAAGRTRPTLDSVHRSERSS